jgi:hypothetical protein
LFHLRESQHSLDAAGKHTEPHTQDEDKDIAIDGVDNLPKERWNMVCHVCQRKEGACLQCNFGHCQQAFHPLCARSAGACSSPCFRRLTSTPALACESPEP